MYEDVFEKYNVSRSGVVTRRDSGSVVNAGNARGYRRLSASINGVVKYVFVHRLVAYLYCKKEEGKDCVNHIDGNKANNNYRNLEWVTRAENNVHAHKNGLIKHATGEKSGSSKITESQAREIRRLVSAGKTTREVGKMFGITHQSVCAIKSGKTWRCA